jgi:hypothetical protein
MILRIWTSNFENLTGAILNGGASERPWHRGQGMAPPQYLLRTQRRPHHVRRVAQGSSTLSHFYYADLMQY